MIKWTTTRAQTIIASQIADRAIKMAKEVGIEYPKMTALMDIEACHSTNPLKLVDLLNADDFNFAHDVFGIREHIDRKTGKLMNCFIPRYSI